MPRYWPLTIRLQLEVFAHTSTAERSVPLHCAFDTLTVALGVGFLAQE